MRRVLTMRAQIAVALSLAMLLAGSANARDDGRYANSPLHEWFNHLASGKGLCCSLADGVSLEDPDWRNANGHYQVRIDGDWIDVPDDAVITEPNKAGKAYVWPLRGTDGLTIRCFMPGSMS